ncbi:MAG: transporter substrate-binding protein [Herminiimonas sp.]|nr:transporter substrate-binding protein [Herminiimonas sp.]
MPVKPSPLLHMLVAVMLGCSCAVALADNGIERIKQRGKFVAAMSAVAAPYSAGAKFRTSESMDAALAEEVAKRLSVTLTTVPAGSANRLKLLSAGKADIAMAPITDSDPSYRSVVVVPTGYSFGPMAIMRSDTDIKTWEQLKGRKVCVAEDGPFAGTIGARYGAIEQRFKAPADSLLALRTGICDAAVHDSTMLEELLKLPEWKKFSARLPTGPRTSSGFLVSSGDPGTAQFLKRLTAEWQKTGYLGQLVTKRARSIAFEVYLDQNVPDCH